MWICHQCGASTHDSCTCPKDTPAAAAEIDDTLRRVARAAKVAVLEELEREFAHWLKLETDDNIAAATIQVALTSVRSKLAVAKWG